MVHGKHVSFCLEQAYGHIVPTLGISMELMRRGHKVSYAVTESFAPVVRGIGADVVVLKVAENRDKVIAELFKENDHLQYSVQKEEFGGALRQLARERTEHSVRQLEALYQANMPDVVVHDDCLDTAGREFASKHNIRRVLHCSQVIEGDLRASSADEEMILVTVPKFFHHLSEEDPVSPKYIFVGFIPEGRNSAFMPWRATPAPQPRILISPTTGLLQQVEFCRWMVAIFRDQPWRIVLSISGSHDALSAIDPSVFRELPANIEVNHTSSNFDILRDCSLYIGQGGQGGALEAIYHGVPQIVIPPTPHHYSVARRVAELGLGVCLPPSELSKEALLEAVTSLLGDEGVRGRVRAARLRMQSARGAELAANILEKYLSAETPCS